MRPAKAQLTYMDGQEKVIKWKIPEGSKDILDGSGITLENTQIVDGFVYPNYKYKGEQLKQISLLEPDKISQIDALREAALSGKFDHEPKTERDMEIDRWCAENRAICNNLTNEERQALTKLDLESIYGYEESKV